MPTVRASRTLAASPSDVWAVVGDPHHLPRWWPRVERVEAVQDGEFTEVLRSDRGNVVRADFSLAEVQEGRRVVWAQQIEGTPFARVLDSAQTAIELEPVAAGGGTHAVDGAPADGEVHTEVSIELRQGLRGLFPKMGAWLVRRAGARTLEQALDGLERIFG